MSLFSPPSFTSSRYRALRRHRLLALLVAASLIWVLPLSADDWPQFEGANRDITAPAQDLLTSWPDSADEITVWKRDLGEGNSAISVVDGRLYTQFAVGEDEFLGAFQASDGKEIWRVRTDSKLETQQGNGPRATPAVSGGLVYAVTALGKLWAVKAQSGEKVWFTDLEEEHGSPRPYWGVSASPLVDGDRLLVIGGAPEGAEGTLLAFDKSSGNLLWKRGSQRASYATPVIYDGLAGKTQILLFTAAEVVGLDAGSGDQLWTYPWNTRYGINVATPLQVGSNQVYISSGYEMGAALLELKPKEGGAGFDVETKWQSRVMENHFHSPVLKGDYLYGFDNAIFKCINVTTGDEMWKARGFGKGSLLAVGDDQLIVFGDKGQLALVEATPEEYRKVASLKLFDGRRTWAMPVLADGYLFLRDEEEMLALDLRKPEAEAGEASGE
ncbi:MAG: PQQ-binding-like beta-propeller repeat protein [Acidobacteriota bacterium]